MQITFISSISFVLHHFEFKDTILKQESLKIVIPLYSSWNFKPIYHSTFLLKHYMLLIFLQALFLQPAGTIWNLRIHVW